MLVEQNATVALRYADAGYIMEGGRIVLEGMADELKSNEDVNKFYPGGGVEGARRSFCNLKSDIANVMISMNPFDQIAVKE